MGDLDQGPQDGLDRAAKLRMGEKNSGRARQALSPI